MQNLSLFDCFGTSIQIRGYQGETTQKSIMGGVVTLSVYTLSFCYFIYIMILWQAGEIGPTVGRYNEVQNYSIYQSGEQSLLDFIFYPFENYIDPFQEQNIILMPLLMYEISGKLTQPKSLLQNIKVSQYNSSLIQTTNLTLILSNIANQNYQDAQIYIVDCDEKYLYEKQQCASQEIVDKFKQQVNYIYFYNSIQTFNTKLKQIQTVQKKQYLAFDFNDCYNLYMQMNSANLNVEDGLLFQNLNFYQYIDDISILSQVQSKEFNLKSLGINYYFCFVLKLSPIAYQVDVRYQNLGEIFAMVGSIASVLMSVGILMEYLNGYYQDNILIYKILSQYFPNKIQINEIGQITEIKGLQDYQQIKKLQELAEGKLNILNIIYSISRLELFLLYKFGRNELVQANDFVIQCNQFEETQEMNTLDPKKFYIEDMELFPNQHVQ
ncbi:hypothetical protein pb186bvf_018287 [Paramecium bursaria]